MDEREAVAQLGAPDGFIHGRFEEEWVSEPEGRTKTHGGVRRNIGFGRGTRTHFALIAEMRFVQFVRGNCGKIVRINYVDLAWTFGSVCGGAVGWNVKGLVLIFRIVEIV